MTTPRDLRATIAKDLVTVRPLPRPPVRALAMLPLALAIVVAIPLVHFFRPDLAALGALRAWGLPLAEVAAGLTILSLALRESIPGRALTAGTLTMTFVAGFAVPLAMFGLTSDRFTIGPPAGAAWRDGLICFRASAMGTVPALIMAAILVARALPLRPAIAGALYGLGSGLIADAGLRLFCDFTVPSHVLAAHLGAILAATLAGAILAVVIERLSNRAI